MFDKVPFIYELFKLFFIITDLPLFGCNKYFLYTYSSKRINTV